jgi:hypothetical protein
MGASQEENQESGKSGDHDMNNLEESKEIEDVFRKS